MRVAVVGGCGALGSALAAALSRAGADVVVIDRGRVSCEYLDLEVEGLWSGRVMTCGPEGAKGPFDVVVFATKAYDVQDAIRSVLHLNSRLYVAAQNGLGSLEALEGAFGKQRAAALISYFGVTRLGKCRSRLAGGSRALLGCRGECDRALLQDVATALSAGGLSVDVVGPADLESERWLKVAVNSAINPVTALEWDRNRVIVEREEANIMAQLLAEETGQVAKGLGIQLREDPVEATMRTARETGDNCSSTVQDLSAGRETELRYINYAVWEASQGLEVKAKLNLLAYSAVEAASRWLRGRRSPCAT